MHTPQETFDTSCLALVAQGGPAYDDDCMFLPGLRVVIAEMSRRRTRPNWPRRSTTTVEAARAAGWEVES